MGGEEPRPRGVRPSKDEGEVSRRCFCARVRGGRDSEQALEEGRIQECGDVGVGGAQERGYHTTRLTRN
jgi:hypothetical protein